MVDTQMHVDETDSQSICKTRLLLKEKHSNANNGKPKKCRTESVLLRPVPFPVHVFRRSSFGY